MTALLATLMAKADAAAAADAAPVLAAAALWPFRPRPFTASAPTRPAGPPSRAFTTPRAGRLQSAHRPCRRYCGSGAPRAL